MRLQPAAHLAAVAVIADLLCTGELAYAPGAPSLKAVSVTAPAALGFAVVIVSWPSFVVSAGPSLNASSLPAPALAAWLAHLPVVNCFIVDRHRLCLLRLNLLRHSNISVVRWAVWDNA